MGRRFGLGGLGALALTLAAAGTATATPSAPTILEPAEGRMPHPADVHMEVSGYSDDEGDAHLCSDWEIRDASSAQPAWLAECAGNSQRVHIHLGDGAFQGELAGATELEANHSYLLRVRFRDDVGQSGPWSERAFTTGASGGAGVPAEVPWNVLQPGFKVENVAGGLQLPVAITTVPNPGDSPDSPLLYVAELYGAIKVLTRDGELRTYAHDLLDFDPTGPFPGSGEEGLGGIVVDPESGDLFASRVYPPPGAQEPNPYNLYGEVIRLESSDDGLSAESETRILDLPEPTGPSHQISNLTIGPDGFLYVHVGDGIYFPSAARNPDSFLGKILRLDLSGAPAAANPFAGGPPYTARDYVWALGFRNPFGGGWRSSNGAHYEVENGPSIDRLARVRAGADYGWDGSNQSMLTDALHNWFPPAAPVAITFAEAQSHGGSGLPSSHLDHAFVTESGPTWATGTQAVGKRVVEFAPGPDGELAGPPRPLLRYTGAGKATAAAIAAGPDGLYFTDLYRDLGYEAPSDPGARLLRIRWVGVCPSPLRRGSRAADRLRGGPGRDTIVGGAGPDRLAGRRGDDCLRGEGAGDVLKGGRDQDRLRGGPGSDRIRGGPGDDWIHGGGGDDLIRCGAGRDTVVRSAGDRLLGCERRIRSRG